MDHAAGRQIAVIGAPTAIGISPSPDGRPRGLGLTPAALRAAGLVERLAAIDLGDVAAESTYRDLARPPGRVRNASDVAEHCRRLASRVADASAGGRFLVLVGGDCSILLGAVAGLRQRREDVGVAYVDAHADFATLDESPSGSACSMTLALATGRAELQPGTPSGEDERPLVRPELAVHIGRRDVDDPDYGSAALAASGIADFPAPLVRAHGHERVAAAALERLTSRPDGFWVHLDVDVLDPELMPAVDSPLRDGLSADELQAVVGPIVRHPSALGLQLTVYDPSLDPEHRGAGVIVDLVSELLGASPGATIERR